MNKIGYVTGLLFLAIIISMRTGHETMGELIAVFSLVFVVCVQGYYLWKKKSD